MKKSLLWILIFSMLLVTSGCARQNPENLPQNVAKKFWDAMAAGDMKEAKALTIRSEIEAKKPLGIHVVRVDTGLAKVVRGRAFVPTVIYFHLPVKKISEQECNATMDTELLKVDGVWLVDDVVTMKNYDNAVKKGVADCSARLLEKSIEKGLKEYEELQKSLQENFKMYKKTFKNSFEKLQKALQKSVQELQKELQESDENVTLPPPQKGQRI